MSVLEVTYRIDLAAGEAGPLAESILIEQSIETPLSVAERYPFVRDHMIGRIARLEPDETGRSLLTLALPTINASVDAAQFVNVVFGNVSLHDSVSLVDFHLPPDLAEQFEGPRHGVQGIRALTGVEDRPLTCTALKPVGLNVDELALLCLRLAKGGIDIIKDDHYLGNHPFSPFEERVTACLRATREAADETGHCSLYCPNLSGSPDEILRQAEFAQQAGAQIVMVAPMLIGLPFFQSLTRHHLTVPVLAHPSFAGANRIRPETLIGKLFRLFGADAVIFANYGGRFGTPPETCAAIAAAARQPWHGFHPALPIPAGGMRTERADELVRFFGPDTGLLVGGGLLEAGDALTEHARAFVDAVSEAARRHTNPSA